MTMELEKQKREALKRMKILGIQGMAIKEFQHEGKLNLSENNGGLYWLNEGLQKRVAEFEKKYNSLVYHVIRSRSAIGEMISYLYVSPWDEEWAEDKADLKSGRALVYVENLSDESLSEFGFIGIMPLFGGVTRLY